MGWDGNGNITRSNGTNTGGTVWQDDKSADIKIRADLHDTHDQDLADAIELTLNRNGENAMAANLKMGGFKLVNAGEGTAADEMATVGQAQRNTLSVAQAAGTDALTASYTPAIPSLADGLTLYVRANAANTSTTPTFSPNGLAAKTIVKNGNNPLIAGDIFGQYHVLILQYRLTNDAWELLNPATFATLFPQRFPNINGAVTATQTDLNRTSDGLFTGKTEPWLFSAVPNSGWLFLNAETIGDTGSGANHEGSNLEALFDLIKGEGAAYGNTGTEVFANGDTVKLPDARDRVLVGAGSMGSIDAARVGNYSTSLGDTGGEDTHHITPGEMPVHNHGGSTGSANPNIQINRDGAGGVGGGYLHGGSNSEYSSTGLSQPNHSHSISSQGSDTPHNNMQPFITCNWIIKI